MYSRLELRFCNICMPSKMVKAQKERLVMSRFFRFYTFRFTTLRELAPQFSPNRHGTCETADNLTIVKVGIRLPTYLPFHQIKRKRIVEEAFMQLQKVIVYHLFCLRFI